MSNHKSVAGINQIIKNSSTLLIDFDDTLVDYYQCQRGAIDQLFDHYDMDHNIIEDYTEEYSAINSQLWPQLEKGKLTIEEIRFKRFEHMNNHFGFEFNPVEVDENYLNYFIRSTSIEKNTKQNLKSLKSLGINLFILTNGIKSVQTKRIQKVGLDKLVYGYLTSEDVGKAKPDPLMFHKAITSLSIAPENCIMIGDSLSSDIKGAMNAGVASIHLSKKHANGSSTYDTIIPNATFDNFNDFAEYFIKIKMSES